MLAYAECTFVPLSSGFAEIRQSVLRNDPIATEEFYAWEILFSGQFKEERRGCMTELLINFAVFTLACFLFPRGAMLFGMPESYTAFCHRCTPHTGSRCCVLCVPRWYWYHNTPCTVLTDVAQFQVVSLTNTPVTRTTCLLTSRAFLQLAVSGINELIWILCMWGRST